MSATLSSNVYMYTVDQRVHTKFTRDSLKMYEWVLRGQCTCTHCRGASSPRPFPRPVAGERPG